MKHTNTIIGAGLAQSPYTEVCAEFDIVERDYIEMAAKYVASLRERDEARADLAAAREALQKIVRGPVKPPPDPGAHSWQAYANYWVAAATDMKFSAIRALAAAPAEPGDGGHAG